MKPTSYEESRVSGQPRGELVGNGEKPRETCVQSDRVTARMRHGVNLYGWLNGGHMIRRVVARLRGSCEGIVQSFSVAMCSDFYALAN